VAEAAKDIFMKKKRFAEGGSIDEPSVGVSGSLPPMRRNEADYAKDLANFIHKNRGRDPSFKDMTAADVARIPKDLGLTILAGYGVPIADAASSVVNAGSSAIEKMRGEPDGPKLHRSKNKDDPTITTSPDGKSGGMGPRMAKGGKVSSASRRGDGCAQRGKTKGRMV
jgi:hypothetical protein